jgi:RimJ/RimL family protein N-acetyltransferase
MQISFDLAKSMGKNIVFLKSMDSSVNSIAFYKKLGFENCGTLTLPFEQMKNEYRGMLILKKEI